VGRRVFAAFRCETGFRDRSDSKWDLISEAASETARLITRHAPRELPDVWKGLVGRSRRERRSGSRFRKPAQTRMRPSTGNTRGAGVEVGSQTSKVPSWHFSRSEANYSLGRWVPSVVRQLNLATNVGPEHPRSESVAGRAVTVDERASHVTATGSQRRPRMRVNLSSNRLVVTNCPGSKAIISS
jgi:hypothetical protein